MKEDADAERDRLGGNLSASDGFVAALRRMPLDYSEGRFRGRRWGVTLTVSEDGRRWWLWGEELGGSDRVSFNLYMLAGGPALRPCEMPAEKVVAFVLEYETLDEGRG